MYYCADVNICLGSCIRLFRTASNNRPLFPVFRIFGSFCCLHIERAQQIVIQMTIPNHSIWPFSKQKDCQKHCAELGAEVPCSAVPSPHILWCNNFTFQWQNRRFIEIKAFKSFRWWFYWVISEEYFMTHPNACHTVPNYGRRDERFALNTKKQQHRWMNKGSFSRSNEKLRAIE